VVNFTVTGSTDKTSAFLEKMQTMNRFEGLDRLGQRGVEALRAATPVESGLTAASWKYEVEIKKDAARIMWINTNTVNGTNIAVILQYGHGTGTGGYIAGRDYIMPAIRPIFDEIANEIWKKVTSA
jgi:hypothetical protein